MDSSDNWTNHETYQSNETSNIQDTTCKDVNNNKNDAKNKKRHNMSIFVQLNTINVY